MDEPHPLEIVGQRARERTDDVVAPVIMQIDRLDAHFKHLPGPRATHGNRPGENVRAAEFRLHSGVDRGERFRHVEA